jgi:hypothetical protein
MQLCQRVAEQDVWGRRVGNEPNHEQAGVLGLVSHVRVRFADTTDPRAVLKEISGSEHVLNVTGVCIRQMRSETQWNIS